MKVKIFSVLSFLYFCNFAKEVDYNKILLNTPNDKFAETVKIFESIEDYKKNAKFWYFYGCLYHNSLLYNILSDDVNFYLKKTLECYKNVFNFRNKEYISYTWQNLTSLYNTFMKRGIEYLKLNLFTYALSSFNCAKQVFEQELTPKTKTVFIQNIENNLDNVLTFHNLLKSTNKNKDLKYCFVDTYFKMNDFEKMLQLIKELLLDDPYDLFALRFLYETKKIKTDLNTQEYLSFKIFEKEFQNAAFMVFEEKNEEAYLLLKKIKCNKRSFYNLYCDVLYNHCVLLQKQKQEKIFKNCVKECIKICKKIFYDNYKNKKILKRLYYLYMSLNDTKSADNIIKFHKIEI